MQVHTCTFIEYKHTHTQIGTQTDRHIDRQTYTQTARQTHRQRDRHTDRHTDRQTDMEVLLFTCSKASMSAPLSSRSFTTFE